MIPGGKSGKRRQGGGERPAWGEGTHKAARRVGRCPCTCPVWVGPGGSSQDRLAIFREVVPAWRHRMGEGGSSR